MKIFKSPYPALNLPTAPLRLQNRKGKIYIFDIIRKNWFVLSKEEWVRQHLIHYLLSKNYPMALIGVEKQIFYHQKPKRFDLVVFSRQQKALMVIECKASEIKLDESVFRQAAVYAHSLQVPYLCISNGINTFCWKVDSKLYFYDLPYFDEL